MKVSTKDALEVLLDVNKEIGLETEELRKISIVMGMVSELSDKELRGFQMILEKMKEKQNS